MKRAFVYSGGGALIGFELGVTEVLFDRGIRPDAVYGTSAGSIMAWINAYSSIDTALRGFKTVKNRRSVIRLQAPGRSGLVGLEPLGRLLEQYQETGVPRIPATVTNVDLNSGELFYVDATQEMFGTFREAVLRSCSIPVIMSARDGFVDGGVREMTPLDRAIEDGADEIYVILCHPLEGTLGDYTQKECALLNKVKTGMRALDIAMNEIWRNDLKACERINHMLTHVPEYCNQHLPGKRQIKLRVWGDTPKIKTLDFSWSKMKIAYNHGRQFAIDNPDGILK